MMGERSVGDKSRHRARAISRRSRPAVQDLVGGQVQMMFDALVLQAPQLAAGNTRALAITTNQRLCRVAGCADHGGGRFLPTCKAEPGSACSTPAGTPRRAAVDWLNAEVKKAFSSDGVVRERLAKQGAQLMLGRPRDFTVFVEAEMTAMARRHHQGQYQDHRLPGVLTTLRRRKRSAIQPVRPRPSCAYSPLPSPGLSRHFN